LEFPFKETFDQDFRQSAFIPAAKPFKIVSGQEERQSLFFLSPRGRRAARGEREWPPGKDPGGGGKRGYKGEGDARRMGMAVFFSD